MKRSSVIKELIQEIRSYKELDYEGWNSYNAAPSDPATRQRAIEFLGLIEVVFTKLNLSIPDLSVGPGVNGGVGILYQPSKGPPYFYMRLEPNITNLTCTIRRQEEDRPELLECSESAAVATLVGLVGKHTK